MQGRIGRSRVRLLLASSSAAALLIGGGAPSAFAQCAVNPGTNQSSVSNSAAINCINIQGITVTGNVTNTGSGIITATGGAAPTATGITINNASVGGAIVNNGSITANSGVGIVINNNAVASGGISNSGTISASPGIYVSNVAVFGNASAGGGIVNSGTISASNSHAGLYVYGTSVFAGGITNSGTITGAVGIQLGRLGTTTAANSISTFTGGISNSGTIVATGATAAAIAISAISVFTGGITNSGSISGTTGILVTGSAPISVFDSGTIIGTGGTAVDLSGNTAGNSFTLGPGYAITGNVLGQGADTFQLGGTGNGTFNLSLIGTQYTGFTTFNEVGSATWTVTGTFGPTNPWTVESGTLLVNGNLSNASLTTVTGGTLGGIGTIGNTQINAGGTFAPGMPGVPGTSLTVAGNLAFQPGAVYQVSLNPATASLANVSGTATLAGTVAASFASGGYVLKQYTILTAAGGLGGTTFSGLTNTDLPSGTTDSLSYSADDVYLNLMPGFTQYTGLNINQQNVANALTNYFNANGGIPAAFFGLTPGGLTQVDGEAATGAADGAFKLMDQFLNLMLDPFVDGRSGTGWPGGSGGPAMGFAPGQQASFPPDVALGYAGVLKAPPKPQSFDQRWSAWGGAFGGSNTTNGNGAVGSNTVTARDYGYAGGLDYHFSPDTVAGFALAGGGTNWGLAGGLGGGRSDTFQAGVYGATRSGPVYVAAALAFANHWMSTNRIALGNQLDARFSGQSYAGRIEAGYRYAALPTVGVTPYAALQSQSFHTPNYSETDLTGGGFALGYNAMTATDTRSELGARFDDTTIMNGMPLALRARLAWAHDWITNPALDAVFQSLPGASFIVNGATPPKNSALASAGAELHLTANWSATAKFDGEFASGSQTYAGTGTLRYTW